MIRLEAETNLTRGSAALYGNRPGRSASLFMDVIVYGFSTGSSEATREVESCMLLAAPKK